jgi:hypothetical protein
MSPQAFSYVFAFHSFGYMLFGFAAGRASQRLSVRDTLIVGLVMCELGAVGVLITAMLHLPVVAVVLSLFILVSGTAVTSPSPTSEAVRPPKAQRVTPITEEAVPATSGYPVSQGCGRRRVERDLARADHARVCWPGGGLLHDERPPPTAAARASNDRPRRCRLAAAKRSNLPWSMPEQLAAAVRNVKVGDFVVG